MSIKVPDHVPAELVWQGRDIAEFPRQFAEPYVEAAREIHAGPPIVWAQNASFGKSGWLLTRHALLEEVYMDAERFPVRFNADLSRMMGEEMPLVPFESDPPQHRHYRQIIQSYFLPSAVRAFDGVVHQYCEELIAGFADRKGCDFATDFAALLPSYLFLGLFGLPRQMLPQFLAWEHSYMCGETYEEQLGAAREIMAYLREVCAEKRRNPGDDLISAIVQGQVEGRPMTDAEIDGMCFLLYGGGLDTVANSLSWHLRHLAMHPDIQDELRASPELIPDATEELLRAYPVSNTTRTVGHDMEFHGVKMRKGDVVALPIFFAARDPLAFPQPNVIDIRRRARSLTFGTGVHNCLGIHLAKRELRIAYEQMLSRFNNIRIDPEGDVVFDFKTTWGIKHLPLIWD